MDSELQRIVPQAEALFDWAMKDTSIMLVWMTLCRIVFGPRAVILGMLSKTIRDDLPQLIFLLWPFPPVVTLPVFVALEILGLAIWGRDFDRTKVIKILKIDTAILSLLLLRALSMFIPERLPMDMSLVLLMLCGCTYVTLYNLSNTRFFPFALVPVNLVLLFAFQTPAEFVFRLEVLRQVYFLIGAALALGAGYCFIHPAYEHIYCYSVLALAIVLLPSVPLIPQIYGWIHHVIAHIFLSEPVIRLCCTFGFTALIVGITMALDKKYNVPNFMFICLILAFIEL